MSSARCAGARVRTSSSVPRTVSFRAPAAESGLVVGRVPFRSRPVDRRSVPRRPEQRTLTPTRSLTMAIARTTARTWPRQPKTGPWIAPPCMLVAITCRSRSRRAPRTLVSCATVRRPSPREVGAHPDDHPRQRPEATRWPAPARPRATRSAPIQASRLSSRGEASSHSTT